MAMRVILLLLSVDLRDTRRYSKCCWECNEVGLSITRYPVDVRIRGSTFSSDDAYIHLADHLSYSYHHHSLHASLPCPSKLMVIVSHGYMESVCLESDIQRHGKIAFTSDGCQGRRSLSACGERPVRTAGVRECR